MQATCFEVVPEETRPWKPEIAPQAIVMKRKGIIGGAPSGCIRIIGAWISGWRTRSPTKSRTSAVISWCAFR